MEQSKLIKIEKIVKTYLNEYYSGLKLEHLKILPKKSYNDITNKWEPDSCSVFMSIKREKDLSDYKNIEYILESMFGFEFCVDFI